MISTRSDFTQKNRPLNFLEKTEEGATLGPSSRGAKVTMPSLA